MRMVWQIFEKLLNNCGKKIHYFLSLRSVWNKGLINQKVSMLNQYELMVIFTPILSEDEVKNIVGKYQELIESNGGEMVHQDAWGLKQLAYTIDKKTTGIYHLYEFKAPGTIIEKLEIQFKRDEKVIRFLITRLDKYAIEYNISRRTKKTIKEPVVQPVEKVETQPEPEENNLKEA